MLLWSCKFCAILCNLPSSFIYKFFITSNTSSPFFFVTLTLCFIYLYQFMFSRRWEYGPPWKLIADPWTMGAVRCISYIILLVLISLLIVIHLFQTDYLLCIFNTVYIIITVGRLKVWVLMDIYRCIIEYHKIK